MGLLLDRSTRSRGTRGAALAVLCVLGALIAPTAAMAQATSPGSTPPSAPTTGATPPPADAADAVPGATGATPPAADSGTATAPPPTDGAAVDPGAVTTNPAAPVTPGVDPVAPGADPTVPGADPTQPPAADGTEATTTGVVVNEPDDSLPDWVWGAVAVGILAAALVAWLLVLASGRFERLAPVGHALGEAGWRLSNRWAEFLDWLRFGSGR